MIRVSLWLLWTVVSGVLAAGLWQAWRAAVGNSASPGAIVLALFAVVFAFSSIVAAGSLVKAWRAWTKARARQSR